MTVFNRWVGALLCAALLALRPLASGAQTPPSGEREPGAEPSPPLSAVEAIEVVGERMDAADVQDEAQAISAFSAEDLDRANIQNIDSLAFSVPGLHVGQTGQSAIVTLRGVGTENASITGEPGIAFHVDGVNYGQPSAARVAFFDLESLDVKRGPQGLLGGKNSTSGTINLITRKPGDEYEVNGDILFGNHDRVRGRGAVNIPLGEFFAARTAFLYEQRDGYLDNRLRSDARDPFDADDFGLRQHLRWNASDSLEALLSYNYFKQAGNGPQGDLTPLPRTDVCTPPGLPAIPISTTMPFLLACNFNTTPIQFIPDPTAPGGVRIIPPSSRFAPAREDADPRSIYSETSAQNNHFWGFTGSVGWDVPDLPLVGETRIKGIGGFQRTDTAFVWDFDATDLPLTILDSQSLVDQHTAELQWSGSVKERLDWQAGGYFAREAGAYHALVPDLDGPSAIPQTSVTIAQETDNKSYGALLHGTFHLTEDVRFDLGGRWIKDTKKGKLFRWNRGVADSRTSFVGCEGTLGVSDSVPDTPGRAPRWCALDYRGTAWGASLDWRPFGGDHLLYSKIDRGYKSGGFRSGGRGEYLPERIWAYTVGSKSELLDSRLQLNLEGFFYAYHDMQLVVLDGFSLRTENTDTRMYGWDLELNASPLSGLNLEAVVSFLKTEVLDYHTLDPASTETPTGDPGNASVDEIRAFNQERLAQRDVADDLSEEGYASASFQERTCFPSPERVREGSTALCGTVTPFGGLDDFSGNQLSRSPEWKYTLAAEYEIPIGRYGSLIPRIQYTWQDDTYYRVFNRDEFDLQESHHLTDAKLIWRSPEDAWEAEAFVTNIEDEAPKTNVLVGPRFFGAPPLAWYGPPRFYGVRLRYQY